MTRDHLPRNRTRCGFTLLEAMMATLILFVIVMSVTAAVTAGQQHAYEAHQRIAGTLAAEDLMGRLANVTYAQLPTWNGYTESVGAVTGVDGQPAPDSFASVGRDVAIVGSTRTVTSEDIVIQGREIRVRSFDSEGRTLADLVRFVPEPQS